MIITATPFEVELIKDITRKTARTELLAELITDIIEAEEKCLYCKKKCQFDIVNDECFGCFVSYVLDLLKQKKEAEEGQLNGAT